MSSRPWIARTLLALLAALVVAVGSLALPPVQRRLATWLVGLGDGTRLAAEELTVGPRGLEVRGLSYAMPGLVATADTLELRVDFAALVLDGVVRVEELAVHGLVLEVSPRGLRLPPSEYFPGILGVARLGRPVELGRLVVDGEVAVLSEGERLATVSLGVLGGDAATPTEGTAGATLSLQLHPALAAGVPAEPIVGRGTVGWRTDGAGGFSSARFEGTLQLPEVAGRRPPRGRLGLVVETVERGERHEVRFDVDDASRLLLESLLRPIARQAEVTVRAEGLGTWLALLDPRLAGMGGGSAIAAELDLVAASARGTFSAEVTVPDPGALAPVLAGRPSLRAGFRGGFSGDRARDWALDGARLEVSDAAGELRVAVSGSASRAAGGGEGEAQVAVAGGWLEGWPFELPGAVPRPLGATAAVSVSARLDGGLEAKLGAFEVRLAGGDRVAGSAALSGDWRVPALGVSVEATADLPALLGVASPRVALAASATGLPAAPSPGPARVALLPRDGGPASLVVETSGGWMPDVAGRRLVAEPARELATITVASLDLATLVPPIPGLTFSGVARSGSWAIRGAPAEQPGIEVVPTAPLVLESLRASSDGSGPVPALAIAGTLQAEAGALLDGTRTSFRLDRLGWAGEDSVAATLSGRLGFDHAAGTFGSRGALELSLPEGFLPEGRAGALGATLDWEAGSAFAGAVAINRFDLRLRRDGAELATVRFPEVSVIALLEGGEVLAATEGPIRVEHAALPFGWLAPSAGIQGELAAGSWELALEPRRWDLRTTTPARVLLRPREGAPAGSEALGLEAEWSSSGDFFVHARPEPSLIAQGTLASPAIALSAGGERLGGGPLSFRAMANLTQFLPSGIDTALDLDLGRLAAAGWSTGLPTSGHLGVVARGGLLGREPLGLEITLDRLASADGLPPPGPLRVELTGTLGGAERRASLDTRVFLGPEGDRSDLAFRADADLNGRKIRFDTALRGRRLDLAAVRRLAQAFPTPDSPGDVAQDAAGSAGGRRAGGPFWRVVDGSFRLELDALEVGSLRAKALRGDVVVADEGVRIDRVGAEAFGGTLAFSGGLSWEEGDAPYRLQGRLDLAGIQTGEALPESARGHAALELPIDLRMTVEGRGRDLWESASRAAIDFRLTGGGGRARIVHPSRDTASTLLKLAGAVTFSPELRALGRLLGKLADFPLEDLRVEGRRLEDGDLVLDTVTLRSPQFRLSGEGGSPAVEGVALLDQPLSLTVRLAADAEMATLLGRMRLLEARPGPDGFKAMREPLRLEGTLGEPDPSPLYDLLAKAAQGSRGTWAMIVRRIERELARE